MKELIKKLLSSGKKDALDSLNKFIEAAGELGYTSEQIEEALDDFHGFPLDDDDLGMVAGGVGEVCQTADIRNNTAQTRAIFTDNTGYSGGSILNITHNILDNGTHQAINQGINNSDPFGISQQ